MGEVGGFKKYARTPPGERDPRERVRDHREIVRALPLVELQQQGARCMECGVPFCHHGCPLGNLIPDWNDLVYRDRWRDAIDQLHRTNNFPEFTGRLCPAPCEAACVLEIDEGNAVTIKQIELSVVSRAWDEGWIVAQPPASRSGRAVAVVGSGPSGLAAAQQLNRRGHTVTLFERDEAAGGLLRFGVPDFKIEKQIVERRVQQLVEEGVELVLRTEPGADELEPFDAIVLCTGARVPRDLPVPGRNLEGVHFAMEYLCGRNRAIASDRPARITATGKHVVVIGGGDTGADCVASAHRERAASVTQIELLGEPPANRDDALTPWPLWPVKLRTSYALNEGGERSFAISTTGLSGGAGRVERIEWVENSGSPPFEPVAGTGETRPAGLVLLAMGFTGPEPAILQELGVELSRDGYATSRPGVFAAGDCRRGQSLVVWAIEEGRKAAEAVDAFLERVGDRSGDSVRNAAA